MFDLTGYSSYEWRISHAISHHTFPNTMIDYEVSMIEPFLMTFDENKLQKNWIQKNLVVFYFPALFFFPVVVDSLKRIFNLLTKKTSFLKTNLFVYFEVFLFCYSMGWKGLYLFFVIKAISSWFISLSLQSHHNFYAWNEGEKIPPCLSKTRDWGIFQVVSSADHSLNWHFIPALLVFGLLHDHALHHLFPTLDHSRIPMLRKELEETCKEFDVPYKSHHFFNMFTGLIFKMIS